MVDSLTNNLREMRNRKGLTQEQVAKAVGVSRQTIIAIEGGNYVPSVSLALRLAKHFSVTVNELFHII